MTISISSAAVIIPTFNAMDHFERLTAALESQVDLVRENVLVVDSSSMDGTADSFRRWGATVHIIRQSDFDHGGTRRLAVELAKASEFVVFLTQDAVPVGPCSLHRLLAAFENPRVGLAYGCQIPRGAATSIERHARVRNYPPDVREERSVEDRTRLGIKTVFCSDSFAAYRRSALDSVGGIPSSAFFAEDQIVAGRMLLNGWRVAYRGDAKATHSHNYSITQEFKRYFDVGVFHARNSWLLQAFGRAEGEGFQFVKSELLYLWSTTPSMIPSAICRTLLKYVGYRLGRLERRLPSKVKPWLSMAPYYWAKTDQSGTRITE